MSQSIYLRTYGDEPEPSQANAEPSPSTSAAAVKSAAAQAELKKSRRSSSRFVAHEASTWPSDEDPQRKGTKALFYTPATSYPPVRWLKPSDRKRILITGGT